MASSLLLARGFESFVKLNDALGDSSGQTHGKKNLLRYTLMNEPRNVLESKPSVIVRITDKAASLGTQPFQH